MIDLTEIAETIAHEKYERARAKYPEEKWASWEDLDVRVKTDLKQQIVASVQRIAEVAERQVREQIAADLAATWGPDTPAAVVRQALKVVRGSA